MRVLILGATGATGVLLIREALERHHTVTIYARSPEKLPEDITKNTAVLVIKGQLLDEDQLSKAMEGVNAVISALGPAVSKGPFHPSDTPLAKAYLLLIKLMLKYNVKRLIALGTSSIRDPDDKSNYKFSVMIYGVAILARTAYKEFIAIGDAIRNEGSDLDWTIVRVPILTSDSSKAVTAGYVGDGKTKTRLSRSAFAAFALEELEKNGWRKKAPLLSSP